MTERWLTDTDLKYYVQSLGLTYRKKDGEYRINFFHGEEATAYYTTDRQDAGLTATAMAETFRPKAHWYTGGDH